MVSPTSLFHPPSKYTQLQTTTPLGPKPVLFTPSVHSAHVSWLLHVFVMKAAECLKNNVQQLLFLEELITEVLLIIEVDVGSAVKKCNF